MTLKYIDVGEEEYFSKPKREDIVFIERLSRGWGCCKIRIWYIVEG